MKSPILCPTRMATLIALALYPLSALAAENTAPRTYNFNNSFIMSDPGARPDLSTFSVSPLAAGTYGVDVYVNNQWRGRHTLPFTFNKNGKLNSCYTREMLELYGINTRKLNAKLAKQPGYCGPLNDWHASSEFAENLNSNTFRLDLRLPQAYQYQLDANYAPPEQWQESEPAFNLGYVANYYNNTNKSSGGDTRFRDSSDSVWAGLDGRLSMGKWMLEHNGSYNWDNEDNENRYKSNQTALKRHLPSIESLFTGGQFTSDAQMFDGMRIIGAGLGTQDAMRPDSATNWAPVIRGIADTNARVTVSQNGRIIHQATVPPGPFSFDTLFPPSNSSDLQVSIQEADGRVRNFTVPYSTMPQLLRPGLSRYSLAVGTVDEDDSDHSPTMAQASYQYGLSNTFTAYTGATGFQGYYAGLVGLGTNTLLGALAVDVTHADTQTKDMGNKQGQRFRLSFNRTLPGVETSLQLEGYYNTSGFFSQRDGLDKTDSRRADWVLQEKHYVSATLNQPLPGNWGALWATGSSSRYRDDNQHYEQYGIGYSASWGNLSMSISAQRNWVRSRNYETTRDDQISLSFYWTTQRESGGFLQASSDTFTENGKFDSSRLGLAGSLDQYNDVTWGVNAGGRRGGHYEYGVNGGWRSPITRLDGTWSQGDDYRQGSVSLSGTMVAHPGGLTFSPERGDTIAVIEAKGAKGARINASPGVVVDGRGYALMPWLIPYRINELTIDPKDTSDKVQITQTRAVVAPYSGSVVPVKFGTKSTFQRVLTARQANGAPLPFGAIIRDNKGSVVGNVGQGSRLFIDSEEATSVKVSWDGGQCTVVLGQQEAKCR
ncbi:fimbrial biogenesis outer membrane usher protein [Shimwellia pseudoproteus]|uniref:fimbria/pilus outer membrane usher protein n=1 Tax=Shimwellia pseudoproteus TaxID=570012 RepID=UPI0018ED3B82|nr:fimbria/pilus outer membrane usher protein [Shimwellia pseudoproteus]MBJ3813849.1 fimbrial biogenesis outer membrane usher protein [Shimwellia pseudoproteus]